MRSSKSNSINNDSNGIDNDINSIDNNISTASATTAAAKKKIEKQAAKATMVFLST